MRCDELGQHIQRLEITLVHCRDAPGLAQGRYSNEGINAIDRHRATQRRTVSGLDVRRQIDTLLDEYTDAQTAHLLNERGMRTGAGDAFDSAGIHWVRFSHKLKSLRQRLLDAGWLTGKQIASKLAVTRPTLGRWRQTWRIMARICNDRGEWLYRLPDELAASGANISQWGTDESTASGAV